MSGADSKNECLIGSYWQVIVYRRCLWSPSFLVPLALCLLSSSPQVCLFYATQGLNQQKMATEDARKASLDEKSSGKEAEVAQDPVFERPTGLKGFYAHPRTQVSTPT
jgi:hypothetical protein